jgi:DNA repair exonuclease SbcCD ATPase subunit
MGASEACPYCGTARPDSERNPLDALYQEVARIREIAERQSPEQETIARLSREVRMLRETVARLRGTTRQRETVAL